MRLAQMNSDYQMQISESNEKENANGQMQAGKS